ncbi:MAG TPA: DUF748 domain-containing protein [Nitrospira sp.]|nr:DUF748 domain-containing protein [Nitrospira sp.]
MIPRWLKWVAVSVAVLIMAVVIAAFFADEPLRAYAERSANEAADGYSIRIGALDLHPLTLSVELHDVVVRQKADPESPLARLPNLVLDAEFLPLLVGKAVAEVSLNDPVVSVTQQLLKAASAKTDEGTAQTERIAWQDRIREMTPFETNLFVKNGEVSYTGPPAVEPVRVTALDVVVRNVTNRPDQGPAYPAELRIAAKILDHAEVDVNGRADPLAKPSPAVQLAVRVGELDLGKILAMIDRADLPIKSGAVALAGHVEYGPDKRAVTIDSLNVIRPNIDYVPQSTASASAATDPGAATKAAAWQERVLELFSIDIREVSVNDGTVTYRPTSKADPVQLKNLMVSLRDIRNIRSETGNYPSRIQVRARVGEEGTVEIDGRGDLFAQPTPAGEAQVGLNHLRLMDVEPIANAYHVRLRDGLLGMKGQIKHDRRTVVDLESFLLEQAKVDYVYKPQSKERQRRQVKRSINEAAKAQRDPDPSFVFRVGHGKILAAEVGFINRTTKPDYRVFMADLNADMDNFSNRLEEGTGVVKVTGKFMGSGPTVVTGTFRPEKPRPDFDLAVKIIKTEAASLNNILRAYGDVDAHSGKFALFSELVVKNNRIEGYVKPLMRDVDVYDPEKDQDKALSQKVYQAVVGGVLSLLENRPRDEVATTSEVSGRIENPQADTWQIIGKLVQNAFFNAILPGFEGKV